MASELRPLTLSARISQHGSSHNSSSRSASRCCSPSLTGLVLRRRWLVLLALAHLWAASTELTAGALWRVVEAGQKRTLASAAPEADATVVLSSRRRVAPGEAGVRGWDSGERFLGGVALIVAERAPWLVRTSSWLSSLKERASASC